MRQAAWLDEYGKPSDLVEFERLTIRPVDPMPYIRCPVCQDLYHLLVKTPSLEEWEREHVRERDADGVPLLECPGCWMDLRAGHRVRLRSVPQELAGVLGIGQEGIVESPAGADGGEILVRLGETLGSFKREDLSYIPG